MCGLHDDQKGLERLANCRKMFGLEIVGLFCLFVGLFVFCLIMFNSGDYFQAGSLFDAPEKRRDHLSFKSPVKLRRKHWLSLSVLREKNPSCPLLRCVHFCTPTKF